MRNREAGLWYALRSVGGAMVLGVAFVPLPVGAYVGPGAGLSALGSLLALLAAVAVAIIGFFWYPVKRILGRRRAQVTQTEADRDPDQPTHGSGDQDR